MAEKIIELKNVNIFQGSNLILQDVNVTVNRGEFVYLVGKTGSGKSSLLKTLYGDLPLKEGEGTVVDFNLKQMDWKKVPFFEANARCGIPGFSVTDGQDGKREFEVRSPRHGMERRKTNGRKNC